MDAHRRSRRLKVQEISIMGSRSGRKDALRGLRPSPHEGALNAIGRLYGHCSPYHDQYYVKVRAISAISPCISRPSTR
jgi:hypothetical protein